jgi:23S rRNA (pseudouridine1915-N3)-methyltransferase
VELVELKAQPSRAAEGKLILAKRASSDWLVALDERGQMKSSVELSQFVAKAQASARDLAFAIGGDEGLDAAVVERAHLVLSLSRMTFPHRLARLLLAEQLYRAFAILRGEPYHK